MLGHSRRYHPILVEDALGRKYPFPSKYDYGALEVIIRHKFKKVPGLTMSAMAGSNSAKETGGLK
jgi:hypothetical protein